MVSVGELLERVRDWHRHRDAFAYLRYDDTAALLLAASNLAPHRWRWPAISCPHDEDEETACDDAQDCSDAASGVQQAASAGADPLDRWRRAAVERQERRATASCAGPSDRQDMSPLSLVLRSACCGKTLVLDDAARAALMAISRRCRAGALAFGAIAAEPAAGADLLSMLAATHDEATCLWRDSSTAWQLLLPPPAQPLSLEDAWCVRHRCAAVALRIVDAAATAVRRERALLPRGTPPSVLRTVADDLYVACFQRPAPPPPDEDDDDEGSAAPQDTELSPPPPAAADGALRYVESTALPKLLTLFFGRAPAVAPRVPPARPLPALATLEERTQWYLCLMAAMLGLEGDAVRPAAPHTDAPACARDMPLADDASTQATTAGTETMLRLPTLRCALGMGLRCRYCAAAPEVRTERAVEWIEEHVDEAELTPSATDDTAEHSGPQDACGDQGVAHPADSPAACSGREPDTEHPVDCTVETASLPAPSAATAVPASRSSRTTITYHVGFGDVPHCACCPWRSLFLSRALRQDGEAAPSAALAATGRDVSFVFALASPSAAAVAATAAAAAAAGDGVSTACAPASEDGQSASASTAPASPLARPSDAALTGTVLYRVCVHVAMPVLERLIVCWRASEESELRLRRTYLHNRLPALVQRWSRMPRRPRCEASGAGGQPPSPSPPPPPPPQQRARHGAGDDCNPLGSDEVEAYLDGLQRQRQGKEAESPATAAPCASLFYDVREVPADGSAGSASDYSSESMEAVTSLALRILQGQPSLAGSSDHTARARAEDEQAGTDERRTADGDDELDGAACGLAALYADGLALLSGEPNSSDEQTTAWEDFCDAMAVELPSFSVDARAAEPGASTSSSSVRLPAALVARVAAALYEPNLLRAPVPSGEDSAESSPPAPAEHSDVALDASSATALADELLAALRKTCADGVAAGELARERAARAATAAAAAAAAAAAQPRPTAAAVVPQRPRGPPASHAPAVRGGARGGASPVRTRSFAGESPSAPLYGGRAGAREPPPPLAFVPPPPPLFGGAAGPTAGGGLLSAPTAQRPLLGQPALLATPQPPSLLPLPRSAGGPPHGDGGILGRQRAPGGRGGGRGGASILGGDPTAVHPMQSSPSSSAPFASQGLLGVTASRPGPNGARGRGGGRSRGPRNRRGG